MALAALRRIPSFEQVNGLIEEWKGLSQLLLDECEGSIVGGKGNPRNYRRVKEEHWTLERGDDQGALKITSNDDDDNSVNLQQLQQMPTILQQLKLLTTKSLPQITSRIIHATSPILHEISRGYFVPLLTVALACLGRIHTLMLRMGRDLVSVFQETVPLLRELSMKKKRMRDEKGIVDWKMLEDLAMSTFIVEAKNNVKQPCEKSTIAASQEWNDLMKQFVEVSPNELTNQMHEFVKEKRWEGAILRFGLDRSVSSSNASNPLPENQLGGENQGEVHVSEREDLSSNDENEAQPSIIKENDNDAGELVNMHTAYDSTNQDKVPGDALDENMARILHREKAKFHIATQSSESSVSKKKRRKKKRGKKNVADGTNNDNEQRLQNNHTDGAKSVENITGNTKKTLLNSAKPQEVEAPSKKRKEIIATDPSSDSVGTKDYSSESRDVAKQNKSKKKSSKKASKKQKRKSSNVMDAIFDN